jgi:hypothetical protein
MKWALLVSKLLLFLILVIIGHRLLLVAVVVAMVVLLVVAVARLVLVLVAVSPVLVQPLGLVLRSLPNQTNLYVPNEKAMVPFLHQKNLEQTAVCLWVAVWKVPLSSMVLGLGLVPQIPKIAL